MGARHNRKRTRSRPRNRVPGSAGHVPRWSSISFTSSASSLDSFDQSPVLPHQQDAIHWQNQWNQWQDRNRLIQTSSSTATPAPMQAAVSTLSAQCQRERAEALAAELRRQQIFGGVEDDGVSLCPSMLQVVIGLFGGVDYEDP